MFIMNAADINFTNSENNPVRPWFKRMIDQLEYNTHKTDNIKIQIFMHPNLWQCISQLYAYGHYFKVNEEGVNENRYFTTYTELVKVQHNDFLIQQVLPIGGRMYPVSFYNNISDNIYFFVNEKLSGCIQHVKCNILPVDFTEKI